MRTIHQLTFNVIQHADAVVPVVGDEGVFYFGDAGDFFSDTIVF